MFRKVAQVSSLGWAQTASGVLTRTAQYAGHAGHDDARRSYYLDGARKIDVEGILKRVASKYAISVDPTDYLFEAIRANTTAVPNENHDAFPRRELLAFNTRLAMPVYATYGEKPHHLNHKTSNPREARGVILDAHYADETPALETCLRCATKTAEVNARTPDGLFCRRCGYCVKDESVEILVAVDQRKDPALAEGVRSGLLRAGSMGCNCVSTECNVCKHVAYSAQEFCSHIRPGNKGSYWLTAAGSEPRRVEARALEAEFRKRNWKWDPRDFVAAIADDGFECRKAHEDCQDVVFDEYSRVHQPADPKALQQEVLTLRASRGAEDDDIDLEMLRKESELLVQEAKDAMAKRAQQHHTAQVGGPPPPAAPPAAPGAPGAPPPAGADAGPPAGNPGGEANVRMEFEVPKNYRVLIQPPGEAAMEMDMNGGPPPSGSPAPEETMPEEQTEKTNKELGIVGPNEELPPPASRGAGRASRVAVTPEGRFAGVYGQGGFRVKVSRQGTATVESPAGPVLLVRPSRRIASTDGEALATFGREVFMSVLSDGLVHTAIKYGAAFSPKMADITDAAINDMKGVGDRARSSATEDGAMHDMRGVTRSPSKDSLAGYAENSTMRNVKRRTVPSTLSDGMVDHELGRSTSPSALDSTSNAESDMRDHPRPEFSMSQSDATKDGIRTMRGVNPKAGAGMTAATPGASVDVIEARYKKLYAAKLEKDRAVMAEESAAFQKALVTRVARALKIVAKRRALNVEESPLKAAVFEVLASDRQVGVDATTGAPLNYFQMEPDLATVLVEAAWQQGLDDEVSSLVARTAELMEAGEQYIADAERDLSKQAVRAVQPTVTSVGQLQPITEVHAHAAELRREAMSGNPVFASAPEVDAEAGGDPAPTRERFDRKAIRAALGDSKVNFIRKELRQPN